MNVAEPPRIQLEGVGPCPSAGRLEALLRASLGAARAPSTGWVLAMRVEKTTATALRAEGDITDGSGTPVARRVVSGSKADCDAVTRAVGVWASLVLDAELSRPALTANDAAAAVPEPAAPKPAAEPAISGPPESAWPASPAAPSIGARSSAENAPGGGRLEPHTLEVGMGTFLMVGPGARAFAGATPYAIVETGHGIFLRPSIAIGEGFSPPVPNGQITWSAGRIDACLRVPGLYPTDQGLKLDVCGGADGGFSYQSTQDGTNRAGSISPFLSVGPSLEMDGELAGALALVLRGVAGVNVLPAGWTGRIEVALSWRLR